MTHLEVGDHLALRGRVFVVRGYSPMGVEPPTVLVECTVTRELLELDVAALSGPEPEPRQSVA